MKNMNRLPSLLTLIALILMAQFATAATVAPSNTNIQYFGRWDWSGTNPKCTWPSLYLKAKFTGTAIKANFTNTFYNGSNLVNVVYTIDGGTPVYVDAVTQINVTGLSTGEHEIMISRRNEANGADLTFDGFTVTGGDITAPNDRPCLKYEFVGNSITCGLSNTNPSPTWNDGAGTWVSTGWEQDSYRSYAPVVSREMGADYRVESHSGQGMYINLNNSLPEAKASDEWEFNSYYPGWAKAGWSSKYDFSADPWKADFFFCLLGTNDWSDNNYNQGLLNATDYVKRYNDFIDLVYAKYPNTTFFVVSPILDVRGWKPGNDAIIQMVANRKAAGDDIYFIDFRNILATEKDFGGDWTHPTTVGHITMANSIKTFMEGTPAIVTKMNSIATGCNGPITDCSGVDGGTAAIDNCSVCSGGTTGITVNDCSVDCNGDKDGTASMDNCSICVEGNTGKTACITDCHGDWGGPAYVDQCTTCVGGNSGNTDCAQDCANMQFDGLVNYSSFESSPTMSASEDNGSFKIVANTTGQYDNFIVNLKKTLDFTNVVSHKVWIRAKATSNVIVTPALRDAAGNIASNNALAGGNWTSDGSNVLQLTTSWRTFVIDFNGKMNDEWGCACNLDQTQITQLYFGINPGWNSQWTITDEFGGPVNSAFTGTIEIDYIQLADENCTDGALLTGIDTDVKSSTVEVYPNPVTDQATIQTNGLSNYSVKLINIHGETVLEFENNSSKLNMSSVGPGMYFLILETATERISKKLIVN